MSSHIPPGRGAGHARMVAAALLVVGVASTTFQVLLTRELMATFYSNELSFGLILAAWMVWGAVGSANVGPALSTTSTPSLKRRFWVGTLIAAICLPVELLVVRNVRPWLGVLPGAAVEWLPMVIGIVTLPAPACLLHGSLFTMGAALTSGGAAYTLESVGAVLGGTVLTFGLLGRLDTFQIAFSVMALYLALAGYRWLTPRLCAPRRAATGAVGIFLLLLTGGLWLGHRWHMATLERRWPDRVFTADSPYGRLAVVARGGQRAFFHNGSLVFETQGTFPEEVVHLPLLMHPDPRRLLLIGGGVAGDVREALKHPLEQVAYVELDPLWIEAALATLPPEEVAILRNPRVTLALGDGRAYVRSVPVAYDVVILDMPPPTDGSLNRFYTREFFTQVHARLESDGIFALGLPSAENYRNPALTQRNASIYHTLQAVFPYVVVVPGEHDFFLAADLPLETDPALLRTRLIERGIETRQVTPDFLTYLLTSDRFATTQVELAHATARPNTDLAPICYYYELLWWASRWAPGGFAGWSSYGEEWRAGVSWAMGGWLLLLLISTLLMATPVWGIWRKRRSPSIAAGPRPPGKNAVMFAVAATGLAEMVLQVVLLLTFQALHGTVYTGIGLLVTAFMGGLAMGGLAGRRWTAPSRRALTVALAALAVYAAGLAGWLALWGAVVIVPPWGFALLATLGGTLGGLVFPPAVAGMEQVETPMAAGRLYAADLVGGCAGALFGGVVGVPLLGIPTTLGVVALIALTGAVGLQA